MSFYPERDPRTIKAKFDVWLARDMLFRDPKSKQVKRFEKHTKAFKIRYDTRILRYLDRMENHYGEDSAEMGRAVAINLDGMIRYVWRKDVLTEAEYNEARKRQRSKFGAFRKKLRGDVGEDGPEGRGDRAVVADSDEDGGE